MQGEPDMTVAHTGNANPGPNPFERTGSPYRVTKAELKSVARNVETFLKGDRRQMDVSIARMKAKMVLRYAGVPDASQPMAAAEASLRAILL